jgi:ribosome-binding protein aMBF1 (putative translation factor)
VFDLNLGFIIQQARLDKGITQEELTEKVEPTKAALQRLRTTSKKACGDKRAQSH